MNVRRLNVQKSDCFVSNHIPILSQHICFRSLNDKIHVSVIGRSYAPPVSALAHSRGPRKRSQHQSPVLEHRDTYGQVQVCSIRVFVPQALAILQKTIGSCPC